MLIYVTRDIERALGMEPGSQYYVIANTSPYAEKIKARSPDHVFLVSSPQILDTYEILCMKEVQDMIQGITKKHGADLLVFKNTPRIEALAKEKKWHLLNPSADLSEKIENKITQAKWLGDLASLLPPHSILKAKEIVWEKTPLIVQWAHGHTGGGTILVTSKSDLEKIKKDFPDREARVSSYIDGPVFTMNIVVYGDGAVEVGNLSYQITGILPFTDNQFTTIGNDWAVPYSILSDEEIGEMRKIGERVGAHMHKSGWKGLFGIDVIHDQVQKKSCLLEVNARQPASTTLESMLEAKNRDLGVAGMTVFESHAAALRGENPAKNPSGRKLVEINDGAQIVQRVTAEMLKNNSIPKVLESADALASLGYDPIVYTNTKVGSDLMRVRSMMGIMEAHLKFNKRGKEIIDTI